MSSSLSRTVLSWPAPPRPLPTRLVRPIWPVWRESVLASPLFQSCLSSLAPSFKVSAWCTRSRCYCLYNTFYLASVHFLCCSFVFTGDGRYPLLGQPLQYSHPIRPSLMHGAHLVNHHYHHHQVTHAHMHTRIPPHYHRYTVLLMPPVFPGSYGNPSWRTWPKTNKEITVHW